MGDLEPRRIDWASAQMEDGALTVQLTGKGSKAWKARFESVLALLDTPHSSWGRVRLNKSTVKVSAVRQGTEPELRHFLESVVLEANSDTRPAAPENDAETEEAGRTPDIDEQMTATFRAFTDEQ
jgi:hypothetical protein